MVPEQLHGTMESVITSVGPHRHYTNKEVGMASSRCVGIDVGKAELHANLYGEEAVRVFPNTHIGIFHIGLGKGAHALTEPADIGWIDDANREACPLKSWAGCRS